MTGEAIEGNYDYGSISDSDKKVVREIIDLMRKEIKYLVVCSQKN
jgi:hypothetical protein